MRRFTVTFETPNACHCCGTDLPVLSSKTTRGKYQFSLPEGPVPTEVSIGEGVRVVLSQGKLIVEVQATDTKHAWDLLPLFNTDAFSHPRKQRSGDRFSYTFDLLKLKPWYTHWWAELKFAEVLPFTRTMNGQNAPAANGATLSIKLENLE